LKPKHSKYQLCLLLLLAVTGFAMLPVQAWAQTGLGQNKILLLTPGKPVTARTPKTIAAAAYQWYKNGQPIPGAIAESYIISEPGIYTVRAFNKESCPSELSDAIEAKIEDAKVDVIVIKQSESKQVHSGEPFEYLLTVVNKGPAQATAVQLKDALPDGLEFISVKSVSAGTPNYDMNAKVLTWTIGTINLNQRVELRLLVKALQQGTITNAATVKSAEADSNPANNTSSDTKQISGLNIPNVFTPNGDGKNDVFEIPDITSFPENEFIVVNRWGNSVYEKKNYRNEWTGEGLNEGTYFYVFKVKNSKGTWDAYKGYVTLLRSKIN
jgi:gliding motility-associated-like protein/uncharacterized repeat protein (TIGR01451 family)